MAERRALDRRQAVEQGTRRARLVERRVGGERRHRQVVRAPLMGTDYGTGWLCFESGTERRRHAPVPRDWGSWEDSRLAACCDSATRVIRRVAS